MASACIHPCHCSSHHLQPLGHLLEDIQELVKRGPVGWGLVPALLDEVCQVAWAGQGDVGPPALQDLVLDLQHRQATKGDLLGQALVEHHTECIHIHLQEKMEYHQTMPVARNHIHQHMCAHQYVHKALYTFLHTVNHYSIALPSH